MKHEHIIDLIDEIASTKSRNEKESLLASLLDENDHLQREAKAVFLWTYSPKHDFWIKDLKTLPEGKLNESFDPDIADAHHYTEVLKKLSTREVTGSEAKQLLSDLLYTVDTKTTELVNRIVTRDLRAGMSAKTINKVFDDLIYIHPYMRCDVLSTKTVAKLEYPCYSQLKMDGMYMDIRVYDDKVVYMTRKGSVINLNTPERDELIIKYASGYTLQGEAIVSGDSLESILNRSEGNGYLNSDDIDISKVKFYVWDMIKNEDFDAKKSDVIYQERLAKVEKACYLIGDFVELVDTRICRNIDDVISHFKDVRSTGQEGTVVKNQFLKWKDGTSTDQLKFKVVVEADLVITGFNEGEGKFAGLVGSVICQSSDGLVEVGVSGFTDKDRRYITDSIQQLIDEQWIMTVKYNDVVKREGEALESLFLPRFAKLRNDKRYKENADTLHYLKENLNTFEMFL